MLSSSRSVDAAYADANTSTSRSDSHAFTTALDSAWPEPYDAVPDPINTGLDPINTGLDRLQMAGDNPSLGRREQSVGTTADVRGDGGGVLPLADRQSVRDQGGAEMTTVSVDRDGRLVGLFKDDPGLVDEIKEEVAKLRPIGLCAGEFPDPQERGEYDCDWLDRQPDEYACPDPISHGSVPMSSTPDLIEQIRRERDEWKARAEAAERKLTDRAQCCVENEALLREVASSYVSFEDPRVGYVLLQVDRKTWLAIQKYREEPK
jgi:hypothetical protein